MSSFVMQQQRSDCSHPAVEGLEGVFDVAFGADGGHVEAVAAVSRAQLEFLHAVDEVGAVAEAGRRLHDECHIFECDEASAGTNKHEAEDKASKRIQSDDGRT